MRGVGVWGATLSIPDKATLLPEPQPNLTPSVAGAVGAIVAVIAAVVGVVVWKSKSGKGRGLGGEGVLGGGGDVLRIP